MSRHIEIYAANNYSSYEAAKREGAVYVLDDVEIYDQYGFKGGVAADLISAMRVALDMVGDSTRIGAVLIENDPIIERLD